MDVNQWILAEFSASDAKSVAVSFFFIVLQPFKIQLQFRFSLKILLSHFYNLIKKTKKNILTFYYSSKINTLYLKLI